MSPLDVALAVARALESINVGYFLGGSMASSGRHLDLEPLLARARAALTA